MVGIGKQAPLVCQTFACPDAPAQLFSHACKLFAPSQSGVPCEPSQPTTPRATTKVLPVSLPPFARPSVRPSVRRKSSRNGDYVEFLAEEEAASTFRRVDSAI